MSLGKGVIRGYDVATGLATVEIVGGHPVYIQAPAASHLNAVHLVEGRRCAVLFFDDNNPRDGVVVAVYDVVADLVGGSEPVVDEALNIVFSDTDIVTAWEA